MGGEGSSVGVKLPKLERGGYIVTWRVTSADSHPVHGAFTFSVGSATGGSEDAALVQMVLSSCGGNTTGGVVYAVIRVAALTALVLLLCCFPFLGLVWSAGVCVG